MDKIQHAALECPECERTCSPTTETKDGGARYVCRNAHEHANTSSLHFRIDGDGELHF